MPSDAHHIGRGQQHCPSNACQFCHQLYSRRDALRRHIIKCPNRGNRPITVSQSVRGRNRHACIRCSSKKLFCDGASPCSTCELKQVSCVPNRNVATENAALGQDQETSLHKQCSVAFLLRDGEEEVFSTRFNFPKPPPATSPLDHRQGLDLWTVESGIEPNTMATFDFDFMTSIFDINLFSMEIGWLDDDNTARPEDSYTGPLRSLCDPTRLSTIAENIVKAPTALLLTEAERSSVFAKLDYLFLGDRAVKFITYYFEFWHCNCRIIHRPSFMAQGASAPLLASIIFLGAMYSPDEGERAIASAVIKHVESYIFSLPLFCSDESVGVIDEEGDFQCIEAGFLTIVTQFWTGDDAARRRAATRRFDELTKASRRLSLLRASHMLEDRRSEETWLSKETRIRTITYLILIDCAFLFFKGIPLRIMTSEIECDLPCEESIFDAAHPFTHPDFSFKRHITAKTAFQALFKHENEKSNAPGVTLLDTFILIHMLYRFVNDFLVLQLFLLDIASPQQPFASIFSDIMTAMNSWHGQWSRLKEGAVSTHYWHRCGFWRNGDQYEAAIRLLLSEKAKPHLTRLLGGYINRLETLKQINT